MPIFKKALVALVVVAVTLLLVAEKAGAVFA